MAIKHIIVLFVETPRKFITAKFSIRKPGSSSVLIICHKRVSMIPKRVSMIYNSRNQIIQFVVLL
jgi:hypothetical protein